MFLIEGEGEEGKLSRTLRLPIIGTSEAEPEHAGLMNRGNDLKAGGDAGFFHLGEGNPIRQLSALCTHRERPQTNPD